MKQCLTSRQSFIMKPTSPRMLVAIVLGVALLGCHPIGGMARHGAAREVITATDPLVIGFAPSVTEAGLENDAALRSALEHWAWGLENAAACLKSSGIGVKTIHADTLTVSSNNQRITLEVRPSADAQGIGAYLVAPGKAGRLMLLGIASAFVHALPGAAAEFFDVADCCTETARELHFCEAAHPRLERTALPRGR